METIQVELVLPVIDETLEFVLPTGRVISELLREMIPMIMAYRKNILLDAEQLPILCDTDRHLLLPLSQTLAACGVRNGARLLLC